MIEVCQGRISESMLTPNDFGLTASGNDGFMGGNAEQNVRIALQILKGERSPAADVVIANAACGFWVAGMAKNLAEGVAMAKQSLDSGAALAKLEALRKISQSFAISK
jgi:anthranilate phosphoribosyltransferase